MADVSAPCTFHRQNRKWQNSSSNINRQENSPCTLKQKGQRRNQVARKGRHQGLNHPTYLRLDSTGENSASSSEDLNGGFSPEIHQGGGLLDKVRSAFVTSQRSTTTNLTQRTSANNEGGRLSSLDSVAEKFSNMNMTTAMNPQPWVNSMPNWRQQHHASGFGGPVHQNAQGQWGQTANFPPDRNHIPIFHPYQYQGMAQPQLLSSTQNYQQNFYRPPWQRMMDRNHPSYPPFNPGFNPFAQAWHHGHQQRPHPPFPWQHWVGPQMMRGCHNQGSMTRQERARSPAKTQRWNRHGYQQRTSLQSDTKLEGCHANKSKPGSPQSCHQVKESSIDLTSPIADSNDEKWKDIHVGHDVDSGSAIHSTEQLGKTELIEKNIAIQNENIECQASDTTCKPEACKMDDQKKSVSKAPPMQRHSSIDLILSNYEDQSSIQGEVNAISATSDSEDSDVESDADSAVETNTDLWESFTSTDDPYNPLCGWRYKIQKEASLGVSPSSIQELHADSGTDEGDNWSETDSDDDYDSGDDISDNDNDVDANLPRSLQLSAPQLQELRKNLSSTPNKKSVNQDSLHHPSVAFILGSPSSSADEDDDWDTLDDTSTLQDNPLWDSFNRVRDPYSPMEAWKCNASNLSSNVRTPMRKQDSSEGLKTLLRESTEQKTGQLCDEVSPKDSDHSDGEGFVIATLRVYAAKDDIDLGLSVFSEARMKRVASASCLRRIQVTPQNKASKKVRFCPDSSFIVLVEKDPPQSSCVNNPNNEAKDDWVACARDRMRFKARIDQLSHIIDPVLKDSHREQVYTTRMEGYR